MLTGSAIPPPVPQARTIDSSAVDCGPLDPAVAHRGTMTTNGGLRLLGHALRLVLGRIGSTLEPGTCLLHVSADRVEPPGGPIAATQSEGQPEGDRHRANNSDEQGVDQGARDTKLVDRDDDSEGPDCHSRYCGQHFGIAEAGLRGGP